MKKLITTSLLALAVCGNAAWAEEPEQDLSILKCKITPGVKVIKSGTFVEFGDLKIKVDRAFQLPPGSPAYENGVRAFALFSYKLPGQLKPKSESLNQIHSIDSVSLCGEKINFSLSPDVELTISSW